MKIKVEIEMEANSLDDLLNMVQLNNNAKVNSETVIKEENNKEMKESKPVEALENNIVSDEVQEEAEIKTEQAQETILPTAEARVYSMEEIARAMSQLRDTKGVDEVMKILGSFGVRALTEIPTSRYNELVTILNEKGVKV